MHSVRHASSKSVLRTRSESKSMTNTKKEAQPGFDWRSVKYGDIPRMPAPTQCLHNCDTIQEFDATYILEYENRHLKLEPSEDMTNVERGRLAYKR